MISIIIAALNEERFLPHLLEDLSGQTIKDYEIIVCDGGSDDKTVEVAKKYGCVVIATKLKKQPLQQNLAVKRAKHDLLLFLDADIRIANKNFLKIAHDEFVNKNLDVAAFYSNFVSRKPLYIICEALINLSTFMGERTRPVAHGGGGIMSTKKST